MSTFIDNYSTLYNISNINKKKRNIFPNLFNSTLHASRNLKNKNDIINLIPIKNIINNNTYQKKFKSYETIDNGNDEIMFKLRLNRGKKSSTDFKNKNEKKDKSKIKSTTFTKKEINLLSNPESYFYHLFHSSRELDNKLKMKQKKITFKKKIKDIKNGFQKKEENVFKQLFLLKKEIRDDDEEKLKGKIISTKTFLDLKIKEILYN